MRIYEIHLDIYVNLCYNIKYICFYEVIVLAVSYNKLWKLLIDKGMNKQELRLAAGVSTSVIAKLSKGQSVTTDILLKICNALDCDFADIMERVNSEQGGR